MDPANGGGPGEAGGWAVGVVAREPVRPVRGSVASPAFSAAAPSEPARGGGAAPRVGPRASIALEWGVLAFAAVAGVMMLWWPLGHDQGIFASNGAVVAAGGEPYRDAYETRGPLVFYLFAALRLLFGPNAWGVRLLDLGIAGLTAVLLDRMLAPFASRPLRRLAGAAWVLAVVALGHKDAAQPDLWIATAVLGGTLLVTRAAGYRRRDLVAFGFLIGLASLTKQVYPVLLAVAGVVVLWRRRGDVGGAARDLGLLTLGWAAPIVVMLGWFWARYGLGELWEAHVTYTLRVYPLYAGDRQSRLGNTLGFFLRGTPVATALLPAAAGLAALWHGRRELALALAAWGVTGLFIIELQGRFFPYHWALLLPPIAVLAAVGCGRAMREPGAGRWLGVAVGVGLIAQTAFTPLAEVRHWLAYLTGRESADTYFARFSVGITNPAEEIAVARYIRARTRPGEPLGMWAINTAIPFLADRPNAYRIAERRIFNLAPNHELTRRYRSELVDHVARRWPTYFVVNRYADPQDPPLAQALPALGVLMAQRYVHDSTFGTLEVLRLRPGALPPSVQRPR